MNWHILGAGSQGLLWASRLQQAGVPARLLQKPTASPLTEISYEHNGLTTVLPVQAEPLTATTAATHVLLTVKATDVEQALRDLVVTASKLQLVVLLQNGVGADALAHQLLPADTVVWLGSSTHGSFRKPQTFLSRGHVVHAGFGAIWLGPSHGQLPPAAHAAALASLQAAQLNVQWDEAIATRLWHKLAINSCINPLTALLNCRNGELLRHPLAQQWLPVLAQEAAAVVNAEGYPINADTLLVQVHNLATATANNYNSMQQDYQQGRTTEIAFITGSLLNAAARHGLVVPHHAEMLTRVQQRQGFGV